MKLAAVVVVGFALAGCASSGPVPIGNDTFMISKSSAAGGFSSPAAIKGDLLKEGNAFCAGKGKTLQLIGDKGQEASFTRNPSAEIQFKCA